MGPVPTNSTFTRVAFGPTPPRPKAVSAPPPYGSASSASGGGVRNPQALPLGEELEPPVSSITYFEPIRVYAFG